MDLTTLTYYRTRARDWAVAERTRNPAGLYVQLLAHFLPGRPVADIGCGAGRDAAWLASQAYPVTGFDAVPELLGEASAAYPDVVFAQASLPDLAGIPDGAYANLLCADVLQHISREDLITAVFSLARVLEPGGRLLLTIPEGGADDRLPDGRLQTALPVGKLVLLLESTGFAVTESLRLPEEPGQGARWLLVAHKTPLQISRGLERVQSVLVQDRKVATYKLALIRSLCGIARNESHSVRWTAGQVYVPMWAIVVRWITYYWPFYTTQEFEFVAQQRGESRTPNQFRRTVMALEQEAAGLHGLLRRMDEAPGEFARQLRGIKDVIKGGPVTHAGSEATPIFAYAADRSSPMGFGWVVVPEQVWLDIARFHHWIEDSLILRWAHLTVEMNPDLTMADVLPLVTYSPTHERDTREVRVLLEESATPLRCVWTNAQLQGARYEVDHVIPFSAWGNNDLWNLLPSASKVNQDKSDMLPSRALLLEAREAMAAYWRVYRERQPVRFGRQVERALGVAVGHSGWERLLFAGVQEMVERVATIHGLGRWEPGLGGRRAFREAAAGRFREAAAGRFRS